MDRWTGASRAVIAIIIPSIIPTVQLSAQGVLDEFSYDNLRPTAIQVDVGVLGSSHLTGAVVGGLRVDYGRIAPRVRVLLGLSYFRSEFDRQARSRFEERIRGLVDDPTGDAVIDVGRIFLSDLTGDLDFQYVFPQGGVATVYFGAGLGLHLRNGSGRAIDGTFVEDALDELTAGVNGSLGAEFHLGPALRFTFDGRGTLSSGLNTVSLRWGIMYRFGREPGAGSREP